jgi:hypothetical protein
MGQITIYLDDETEKRLRSAAEGEGLPVSRWIGQLIQARMRNEWPQSVREMAGAWPDFPKLSEIREPQGDDLPREEF